MKLLDHWQAPEGAGAPVACLATSFTFDAAFFNDDCLARFLSLSSVPDAMTGSSIAAVLEEEMKLAEAQVCVLVDRTTPAERRNLRWDVVPVTVPGGFLHAKVAVLLWEHSARIILGSANLTRAGYREQIETAIAIDLDANCAVPRAVLNNVANELRNLTMLAPGSIEGAKARALGIVDTFEERIASLSLPAKSGELMVAIAPARAGVNPLEQYSQVWKGARPLTATVLSPFWDEDVPAGGIEAIRALLTGRPVAKRELTVVVGVDRMGQVQADPSLGEQQDITLLTMDNKDDELRRLHAKVLVLESDTWLAAMIGSSNATEVGYGLQDAGHEELNVWLGCAADSKSAKALRALIPKGAPLDIEEAQWEPVADEDDPGTPQLPLGFLTAVVHAGDEPYVEMTFDPGHLPGAWEITMPTTDHEIYSKVAWNQGGRGVSTTQTLPDAALPPFLVVQWQDDDENWLYATWTANVADPGQLPPPEELQDLPVDAVLAALASSRPVSIALEAEIASRTELAGESLTIELDPLRRFDSTGLLLHRTRLFSLALARMRDNLERPISNLDALQWRLSGVIGPVAIADGLVAASTDSDDVPGEAHFRLAELALTVASVRWQLSNNVNPVVVDALVRDALQQLDERLQLLPALVDVQLASYVDDAMEKARA